MLRITWLEFFLRGLPEAFLLIIGAYIFSNTVINIKKLIISSVIFLIAGTLIRILPIQYGVHTILSIIVCIILTVNICKISIIKSIQGNLMSIILEFICEGINVFIIKYIFKENIMHLISNPTMKILYGIPSLLIFTTIITIFYFYKARVLKLKGVINGETF